MKRKEAAGKKAAGKGKVQEHDQERGALVKKMEGGIPYDKGTYINQAKFYLNRSVEDILTVGRLLLMIKEKEGRGEFVKICEEEIGIPHTTAYRFMNAAAKSDKFPAIDFSQLGKKGHVYALLEAPEEDLKRLESEGVMAGKSVDELDRMSVKEMRSLIRDLKANRDHDIEKATKTLSRRLDAVVAENEALRVVMPGAGASKAAKQIAFCHAKYDEFNSALNGLIFSEMELEDATALAEVEGLIQKCYARLSHLGEKYQAYKKGEAV